MAIVIYSESDGVYIGSCLGLGFWSKLDPVGQESAATFASGSDAQEFMNSWDSGVPADIRLVEVEADDGDHASIAACMRAGLPGWSPADPAVDDAATGCAP